MSVLVSFRYQFEIYDTQNKKNFFAFLDFWQVSISFLRNKSLLEFIFCKFLLNTEN
jgi:hypothetical protein